MNAGRTVAEGGPCGSAVEATAILGACESADGWSLGKSEHS
jgi:hypothetical protein